MLINKAYKTELDPTNKQCSLFLKHTDAARFAFNWGLERRIKEYQETGKSSSAYDQMRQLAVLKKTQYPWLYEVSSRAVSSALSDLDAAYKHFFRRVKNGGKPGFPRFKSRKRSRKSFRLYGAIHVDTRQIKLPRIGWVRLKECGYLPSNGVHVISATVSETAGRWFVSLACQQEIAEACATGDPIGVDVGINHLAVSSDGRVCGNPKALKGAQTRIRKLSQELCRRQKGSRNREKTRQKLAKAHARIANIRRDSLHKTTSMIIGGNQSPDSRPAVVAIEDLNVAGMTKNHHIAGAISDAGLSELRRQLEYKAEWYGSTVFVADRFYPSSRTCHHCGWVKPELDLCMRTWRCEGCGALLDRDLNAAINLRDLAVGPGRPEQGESRTPAESV